MNHIETSEMNVKRAAYQYKENVSNEDESTANFWNFAYRTHVQLKPIHSTAVAMQIAQLCIWLSNPLADICVVKQTVWVAHADNFTVQLRDVVPSGKFVQTGLEAVIQFPGAEGCRPAEIHRQMSAVYGAACVPN
jgi:hypothetical protein